MERAGRRRDHRGRRPGRRIHELLRAASRTGPSRCARSMPTARCARSSQNGATGARYTAVRGKGACARRRAPLTPSTRSTAMDGRWSAHRRHAPVPQLAVAPVPGARLGGAGAVRRRRRRRSTAILDCTVDAARAVGLPRRPARVPRKRRARSSTLQRPRPRRRRSPTLAVSWSPRARPSCSS